MAPGARIAVHSSTGSVLFTLESLPLASTSSGSSVRDGTWVSSWLAVNPLPFPLLVDETRDAAKAYGVYKVLGLDGINIARPATFLVAPGGDIVWEHIGENKTDRPSDEAVMAAVRRAI